MVLQVDGRQRGQEILSRRGLVSSPAWSPSFVQHHAYATQFHLLPLIWLQAKQRGVLSHPEAG